MIKTAREEGGGGGMMRGGREGGGGGGGIGVAEQRPGGDVEPFAKALGQDARGAVTDVVVRHAQLGQPGQVGRLGQQPRHRCRTGAAPTTGSVVKSWP